MRLYKARRLFGATTRNLDLSASVRNLGILFDSNMSFKQQINSHKDMSLPLSWPNLRRIRSSLDFGTARIIATALVHFVRRACAVPSSAVLPSSRLLFVDDRWCHFFALMCQRRHALLGRDARGPPSTSSIVCNTKSLIDGARAILSHSLSLSLSLSLYLPLYIAGVLTLSLFEHRLL